MSNNTITKGEITNGEDAIDESIMNDMKDIFQEIDQAELELAKQQVKLFTPIYEKQRKVFEKIPKFWAQALTKNSLIAQSLSYDDYEVVQYITDLNIKRDDPENLENYSIIFKFSGNPYFSNEEIEKKFFIDEDGKKTTTSTTINWFKDKAKDDGDQCFFRWVAGDSTDDMNWEIGGIIKDDFFPQAWKKPKHDINVTSKHLKEGHLIDACAYARKLLENKSSLKKRFNCKKLQKFIISIKEESELPKMSSNLHVMMSESEIIYNFKELKLQQ
ncbi:3675_t:CDS:2 [Entrophospora sp. SA101]|nr:3675_t:CDS:2 [Entrophospora sp. SA101]